ncbi:MAG TPA: alkaline phosphatase family protein, partial [Chloroflexota bacterium]|nr:alkaline phosphatase family protein [Chloroflexota bacterium]
ITSTYQYDGDNMPGLLQAVPAPYAVQLRAGTDAAMRDIQFATAADQQRSPHNPIPATSGGATPIKHVILIVRENRTFDQVLGDAGVDEGRTRAQLDGDPSLTVFGRAVTPNAHALVGDPLPGTRDPAYATADNFYSNGEASIQGHYWTTSANVSDYVEKSWRQYYSPRQHLQDPLSSIAELHNCSIFQAALRRQQQTNGRFSFRDYGETIGIANANLIADALGLPGNASPGVPEHCTPIPAADVSFAGGSNLGLDVDNRTTAKAFLANIGLSGDGVRQAGARTLPNFSYLIMAGDHTGGLAFTNTPRSRVAQNDAGLGLIVQALSHSTYWSSTAIFVLEDDSQDGLDHRDGHRNLLLVISPYARHTGADGKPGYVGHDHYSQASVLKTIELICGFPSLSTYDENASPLYDLFQDKDTSNQLTAQDRAPFTVQPAPSFINETSARYRQDKQALSFVAGAESRSLNLWVPDVAGPLLEVINWQLAHPGQAVPAALRQEQSSWHPYTFGGQDRDGG